MVVPDPINQSPVNFLTVTGRYQLPDLLGSVEDFLQFVDECIDLLETYDRHMWLSYQGKLIYDTCLEGA